MAYATLNNLKVYLGSNTSPPGVYERVTDRVNGTTADDAVGQDILDAAHGEVNGWLAKRYAVPVDVSSDTTLAQRLQGVVLDIAGKVAWATQPRRKTVPRRAQRKYDEAIAWLRDVSTGKASLPGVAAIPAATADGPTAESFGQDQVMGGDSLAGW